MRCHIKIEIEALNHQRAAADASLSPLDVLDAHFLQANRATTSKSTNDENFLKTSVLGHRPESRQECIGSAARLESDAFSLQPQFSELRIDRLYRRSAPLLQDALSQLASMTGRIATTEAQSDSSVCEEHR